MAWHDKVVFPTVKYTLIFGLPPVIPGVLAGWFSGGCCAGTNTPLLERLALILSPPLVLMKLTGCDIRFADPYQGLWFALVLNPVCYFLFFAGFFSLLSIEHRKKWTEFCPYCGTNLESSKRGRCPRCGAIVGIDPRKSHDE
jgi:hypothetical protein